MESNRNTEADFLTICVEGMSSASDKHIPAGASRLVAPAAELDCMGTIVGEVRARGRECKDGGVGAGP